MASDPKVPKIIQKIGTHNGVFHCDEALACYMLKQLPEYSEAEIIRTRDSSVRFHRFFYIISTPNLDFRYM